MNMTEETIEEIAAFDAEVFPVDKWDLEKLRAEWSNLKPFILWLNDKIIGYCLMRRKDRHGREQVTTVDGIATASVFRNRGLATMLLEASLQWALGEGYKRVEAQTRMGNKASIHLFVDKFGFEIDGTTWPNYYRDGAPALLLAKDLT